MGYAIPFAIAGIPLGMLIDRVNRVRVLAVVGLLSDVFRVRFGADSLRYAMLGFGLVNLWTAIHFILAARRLRSASGVLSCEPAP